MSDMEESIKRGLEQSARGEVYDLGDFRSFVEEREELIDLIAHFTGSSDVDATEIADAIMGAGWLSTKEHMSIVADSARYSGAVNRSLQKRLDKAEKELAEVQEEVRCLRAGGEY